MRGMASGGGGGSEARDKKSKMWCRGGVKATKLGPIVVVVED